MSGDRFPSDWLALREPVDHAARSERLVDRLGAAWRAGSWSRVVDLGTGTGSNVRYLLPRLVGAHADPHTADTTISGAPQRWTLVDHDAELLDEARRRLCASTVVGDVVEVETVEGDLATVGLARARSADLVTASALLDLVSESWMRELVRVCREAECALLMALSYDGRVEWSGARRELDARVNQAVNQHQRRDKGLGGALGPDAAAVAAVLLREAGLEVHTAASPWRLGAAHLSLARRLVEGWVEAAGELHPDERGAYRGWARSRLDDVATGRSRLHVGHVDLLALPRGGG